jgi:peroxiredoxin
MIAPRRTVSALLMIGLATACGRSEPAKQEEAPPAVAPVPAPTESIDAAAKPAEPAAPAVQLTPTPSAKVGTLPAGVGVAVGKKAPDFTLKDTEGAEVKLSALVKESPVLLVFYRGGWCPYCNVQIRDLTMRFADYRHRNVTPVAVSVDTIAETAKTDATYTIPFRVLSDPDRAALKAYKVEQKVADADVATLKGHGIDLEAASGRDHHVIAIPSMFLIDGKGVVRWAHADGEYTVRPTTDQVLAAIDALNPTL